MASLTFKPGTKVNLDGLVSRADLNGQVGTVVTTLANGRLQINLISIHTEKPECLSLKPTNVTIMNAGGNDELANAGNDVNDDKDEEEENSIKVPFNSCVPPPLSRAVIQSLSYFYAIGNTPARMLTANCSIDSPSADVLLLGCGDPRSIMYTSWCMGEMGGLSAKQVLNVLMCDIEASVIARNVLLFSLITTGVDLRQAWCVFYSKMISDECMKVLQACASNLLAVGAEAQRWNSASFGKVFPICDNNTYTNVRAIWSKYAAGPLSAAALKMVEKRRKDLPPNKVTSEHVVFTAADQAHPTNVAIAHIEIHNKIFHDYYNVGLAPRCIYKRPTNNNDSSNNNNNNTSYLNPLSLQGVDQMPTLHYGTDPTLGFHLSTFYATRNPDAKVTEDDIYNHCFNEFSSWCRALTTRIAGGRISVACFAGDAFTLCWGLRHARMHGFGAKIQRVNHCPPLELFPICPLRFDSIDTSNISDHCGLLNLLVGCAPLLHNNDASTLSTECLVTSSVGSTSVAQFVEEQLSMSLEMVSVVCGLNLAESLSPCSNNSINIHAFMSKTINSMLPSELGGGGGVFGDKQVQRVRVCLEWRLSRHHTIAMSPPQFVSLFENIYNRAFRDQFHIDMIHNTNLLTGKQNTFGSVTIISFAQLAARVLHRTRGLGDTTTTTTTTPTTTTTTTPTTTMTPTTTAATKTETTSTTTTTTTTPSTITTAPTTTTTTITPTTTRVMTGTVLIEALRRVPFMIQSNVMQELAVWFTHFGLLTVSDLTSMTLYPGIERALSTLCRETNTTYKFQTTSSASNTTSSASNTTSSTSNTTSSTFNTTSSTSNTTSSTSNTTSSAFDLDELPLIVSLTLYVPKKHIHALSVRTGHIVQLDVKTPKTRNIYSCTSVQHVKKRLTDDPDTYTLSSFVDYTHVAVSADAQMGMLVYPNIQPKDFTVTLQLTQPCMMQQTLMHLPYRPEWGVIFSAPLIDTTCVRWTPAVPIANVVEFEAKYNDDNNTNTNTKKKEQRHQHQHKQKQQRHQPKRQQHQQQRHSQHQHQHQRQHHQHQYQR